ncbi:unnamed protein product, partial [Mycena citricolor]
GSTVPWSNCSASQSIVFWWSQVRGSSLSKRGAPRGLGGTVLKGAAYERVLVLLTDSVVVLSIIEGIRMSGVLDVWRDMGNDDRFGELTTLDVEYGL